MVASGLLHFGLVCPYPVLKGPIEPSHRWLRMNRFCFFIECCLAEAGQEGIDILAGEFLGLIGFWKSGLASIFLLTKRSVLWISTALQERE